ncbi:MAG: tyrosine--tRNA ligase [Candidatus Woesearchaeota archaeon]
MSIDMSVDEKVELILNTFEEIVGEDELRELFRKFEVGKITEIRAYDGFEPSGQIHIAQGLMRAIQVNKLTSCGITFIFWVADYFAWLNNKYGGDLEKIQTCGKYLIEVWKSCGMDLEKVEFRWTSKDLENNPKYWENFLKLSTHPTVSRVLRCGQIMGREESTENPTSQIVYPLMQANDIHHLRADIAQLGLDQRKVNMLARDIYPKMGWAKPIVISHHMLLGLQKIDTEKEGNDRKIEMKMSKSKPNTAIFMTDSKEDVEKKFKKAHSIDGVVEDNPVLEYFKYIVFERFDEVQIERPEKFGGLYKASSYDQLINDFKEQTIKSLDLKMMCANYINELLEPTRKHFEENAKAKELLQKVQSFAITR